MHIPFLSDHALHIWLIHRDDAGHVLEEHRSLLSRDELARADRMPADKRVRYLSTRGALRHLISAYTGDAAESTDIALSATGKPYLSTANHPLNFSISHTDSWSLLAFRRCGLVGVDIEPLRKRTPVMAIARRFFTTAEQEAMCAAGTGACRSLFFRIWTRKEALVKARGSTMMHDISLVSLYSSDDPLTIDVDGHAWIITMPMVARGYYAAVAASAPATEPLVLTYRGRSLTRFSSLSCRET